MAIIGFYSVKGGSTRTTLAVNLAFRLALNNPEMKIGLVDCDFEQVGAGMDVFLATALSRQLLNVANGEWMSKLPGALQALYVDRMDETLLDFLADSRYQKRRKSTNVLWIDAIEVMDLMDPERTRVLLETIKDRIWFMPCGMGWSKLARLQYTHALIVRIREVLLQMQRICKLDHIFVDCRSGIADSGFAAALATDCLVMPVLPSNLHLAAAKDGTEVIKCAIQANPKCYYTKNIQYVISKSKNDESVTQELKGFFNSTMIGTSVAMIPWHQQMATSEVIAAIPAESGFSPDDQRYLEALDFLWRLMNIRTVH